MGFVVALPAEARTLVKRRAGFNDLLELPGGHWLIVSGAGPNHARRAAFRLLEHKIDALLSWGCAAALAPSLKAGDLVLPDRIKAPDGTEYSVCAVWHDRVRKILSPMLSATAGVLLGSHEVIANAAKKQELHASKSAMALDMESASVASVAAAHGLPFLVIRAIADPADMSLPNSVTVAIDERGDVKLSKLLAYALTHPAEFVALARLGKAFYAAANTLRQTARRLGIDSSLTPSADCFSQVKHQ